MTCRFDPAPGIALLAAALAIGAGQATAADAPAPEVSPRTVATGSTGEWVNVTGNVGGDTWGYAGVTTIACVPDADEVIAGVSERGLWSSSDGGQTWKPLGTEGPARIACRPYAILFDPADTRIFWVSGNYGAGLFRTSDGGRTFERIGNLNHLDGLAIDFTDLQRKTILVGLHEQARSVMRSTDGGKTWKNIGKNLPEKTNHSTNPLIIDAKTYLVNAAGWLQGHSSGIFRTEDGGNTWSQVSDLAAAGQPLVASDRTIYWGQIWDRGLLRSADQGKTWTPVDGPVKRTPVELPGRRLLAPAGKQLYLSTDEAKSWQPVGPPCPFAPSAVAYNARRSAIFISRSTEKKTDLAIARYDLGAPLEVAVPKKLVVWDGESAARGKSWSKPEGVVFAPIQGDAHSGSSALEFRAEGEGWMGGGWNWHAWWPKDAGTDIFGMKNLVFWVRFKGEGKPKAWPKIRLSSSGGEGRSTREADLLKHCPALFDGQWHEVVIPLADLIDPAGTFDTKKVWELNVGVPTQGPVKFSLLLDDIGFDDRPAAP